MRVCPSVELGLGGGFDANGSTESFELVTEDNNGEGGKKPCAEGNGTHPSKREAFWVKTMQ